MKNYISILFITIFSLSFITPLNSFAEMVLKDTFNNVPGAVDVNVNITNANRQFGTLAPINYLINHNTPEIGESSANPDELTFVDSSGCGPNYDFTDSKNYTIEFDLIKVPNAWLSFAYGKPGVSAPNTDDGFGIIFKPNGQYTFFDEKISQASYPYPALPCHFVFSVSMDDTNSARTVIFANGTPLKLSIVATNGTNNGLIYSKINGIANNIVSFLNLNQNDPNNTAVIDNLRVNATQSKFQQYEWTDDSNSQVSTSKVYTHAVNLASEDDVVINGVTFTGSGTNGYSGADWAVSDGMGYTKYYYATNIVPAITGMGSNLVSSAFYNWTRLSEAVVISNLTPGKIYMMTLYCGVSNEKRISFIAGSDSESKIELMNQNNFLGKGQLIKYNYVAPENGVFAMAITTVTNNPVWWLYAFSNEESIPVAPNNVSASQATYSDKIVISWSEVEGASKYQIYRNVIDNSSGATIVSGEITTNVYDDTTVTPDVDYYYWVKAGSDAGWSGFSASAMGYATTSTGPTKPTNISPENGAIVSNFPVKLQGSAYSDPDSWPMEAIEWQIDLNTNTSYINWDSGIIYTNVTEIEPPTYALGTQVFWRVRYKNNRTKWSEWSDYTVFNLEIYNNTNSTFYFYDTFNNISKKGNVNKDFYSDGRQLGTETPANYSIVGATEVGVEADKPNWLKLNGVASCSPNINFNKSTNFRIDFDLQPGVSGTAIVLGKTKPNDNYDSADGLAIVFYGNDSGNYDVYDGATKLNTAYTTVMNNNLLKTNVFHVTVSISTTDFDSYPPLITVFINGNPLPLEYNGTQYRYCYKKMTLINDSYANFITLQSLGGEALVDNFEIRPINNNFSESMWLSDVDSGVNAAFNYTHAVNINNANDVTINSVLFKAAGTNVTLVVTNSGNVYSYMSAGSVSLTGSYNNSAWQIIPLDGNVNVDNVSTKKPWFPFVGDPVVPWYSSLQMSGEGKKLVEHFLYDNSDSVQISLHVTPGSSNVFSLYDFSADPTASLDNFYFSANDCSAATEVSPFLYDQYTGMVVKYEYQAPDNGRFNISISNAKGHPLFAFSNYETGKADPIFSTVNTINFGETVIGTPSIFYIPIFNFGSGVVSGEVTGVSVPFSLPDGSFYSALSEMPDFVSIRFSPDSEGDFSETITLTGTGGSEQVNLIGTAVPECGIFLIVLLPLITLLRRVK